MTPFATFENVSKRYGTHIAVMECSFSVGRGEVIGFAGPNGAGKTTIARMLLGFAGPSSGAIIVDALAPAEYRRRSGVGYAPEEAARPWTITLRQLLSFRLSEGDPERASAFLGSPLVQVLLDRRIDTMSKGQWRIALVAYAMASGSGLVVLDEPDSGLDPAALDAVREAVAEASAVGTTVVVLSHNLDELQRMCGRLVIVGSGRVLADVSRADLGGTPLRDYYREAIRS